MISPDIFLAFLTVKFKKASKKLTRDMEKRHGPFDSVIVKNFTRKELDDSLMKCKLSKLLDLMK